MTLSGAIAKAMRTITRIFYSIKRNLFIKPNIEVLIDEELEIIKNGDARVKILYIATKYDYNDKSKGLSYEEHNFFHAIKKIKNIEVLRFDYYTICLKHGEKYANQMIKEVALLEGVDKILILLYLDSFNHKMLRELSDKYSIRIVLWLFDDDKRFLETGELAHHCDVIVTTIKERHLSRLANGLNSRLAQFAANHNQYKNYNQKRIHDVVFIGQNFGNRQLYVEHLKKNNINVLVFGHGWPNGKVSQGQMIDIFNKSKIVLNFSSSYDNPDLKYLKGRVFEIPATGTFLLTEVCNELGDYFTIGSEVETFANNEELLEKVKFYLENNSKRDEIAFNGMKAVLKKYTYERYLSELFFEN